jgi:hypothetical protein
MKSKCTYYQIARWCPHDCNPCPDKTECAAAAGYVRSTNPQDAKEKEPYPWTIEAILSEGLRWEVNRKTNAFDLLPKKPWKKGKTA